MPGQTERPAVIVNFQVNDLSFAESFAEISVYASGSLDRQFIDADKASGPAAAELSEEIKSSLAVRYFRDPRLWMA